MAKTGLPVRSATTSPAPLVRRMVKTSISMGVACCGARYRIEITFWTKLPLEGSVNSLRQVDGGTSDGGRRSRGAIDCEREAAVDFVEPNSRRGADVAPTQIHTSPVESKDGWFHFESGGNRIGTSRRGAGRVAWHATTTPAASKPTSGRPRHLMSKAYQRLRGSHVRGAAMMRSRCAPRAASGRAGLSIFVRGCDTTSAGLPPNSASSAPGGLTWTLRLLRSISRYGSSGLVDVSPTPSRPVRARPSRSA
jgi:hypothetical protein